MSLILNGLFQIFTAFIGSFIFYLFTKYYESHPISLKNIFIALHKDIKTNSEYSQIRINISSELMVELKRIAGVVLIGVAIFIFALSYNAYMSGYNKTISTSNFTFLFSGIFWDLVGIIVGAVLFAIGLILAYPKGAKWIANRNR